MALTIYEGIRDEDLVDENINEVILRLLGMEDINDLDYETYKTLLKERMVSGRMSGSEIPSEETELLTNEYKRVRKDTGRFKVRKKNVNFSTFTEKVREQKTNNNKEDISPLEQLMPSSPGKSLTKKVDDKEEPEVEEKKDNLMDFLSNMVAPSLSKIESSLTNILQNMSSQQKAEEKAANKSRVAVQKGKAKSREEDQEGGKFLNTIGNIAKKVFSPLSGIFSAIFKFLSTIVAGFLAVKLIEFLQDPMKIFRDLSNSIIGFGNAVISMMYNTVMAPFNLMIFGLNNSLQGFEDVINNTVGKLPGIPEFKIPEIPYFKPPQIPTIPDPKEPPSSSQPKETEKAPVTAMSEGGSVTKVTNKYYQIMSDGGKVTTTTGEKVSGAGPDTQLVALQPGEVVMSKKAVDAYGADTLLEMNSNAGGTNVPRMARVTSVDGQVPAMQGGGMVDDMPDMSAMTQYISGDKTFNYKKYGDSNKSFYDKAGHGTTSTYHEHFAFKDRETAEAAYLYFKKRGIQVTEFEGYDNVGSHTGGSAHYSGLAFDVPGAQWGGSGAIGAKDYAGSAKARGVLEDFFRERQGGKPKGDKQQSQQSQQSQMSAPKRSDFPQGRSGHDQYERAQKNYQSSGGSSQTTTQVTPTETSTGQPSKGKDKKGTYGSSHIKDYIQKNGITDPTEVAMFMAQMSHESGSFKHAEEIHDGSNYEGSKILGNTQSGDGKMFKGRGYIQLTGRWNYGHYGKMIGVDLVNNPELAADPEIAAKIAVAYWNDRVDRDAARKGDVKTVTKNINGGYNGLDDRKKRFDTYMSGNEPAGDVKGNPTSGGDVKGNSTTGGGSTDGPGSIATVRDSATGVPMTSSDQAINVGSLEQDQQLKPGYGNTGLPMVDINLDGSRSDSSSELKPVQIDGIKSGGQQTPTISPTKKPMTPPPPPKRSGGGGMSAIPIPSGGGGGGSSSSQGNSDNVPVFDPLDNTNPELIVVKAIYNIIG